MTEFLSLKTIAALLDTKVAHLRYLIGLGKFPSPVKMGSHAANWILEKEVLRDWLSQNRVESDESPSSEAAEDPTKKVTRRGFTAPGCRV